MGWVPLKKRYSGPNFGTSSALGGEVRLKGRDDLVANRSQPPWSYNDLIRQDFPQL
jgi:hypothetical protein